MRDVIALALTLLGGLNSLVAAEGDPPQLPSVSGSCVGTSPVHYAGTPRPVTQLTPQRAWPLTRGSGATVSIVDSGVAEPPALAGAVRPGRDIVAGGPATDDCLGRGTALAGIVAARPQAKSGVVGIATAATVIPVRITDNRGNMPDNAVANGIQAATQLGAGIILVGVSLADDTPVLRAAVEQAISADIVVVAPVVDQSAAGQPSKASYPAAYEGVLGVGGIDAAGRPIVAISAERGVDVLAPAVDAVSVGPAGGHYRVSGMTVAAAHVAGTAALIRSYHPKLTQTQVRQRLASTTDASGTVDPYTAVAAIDPGAATRSAPGAAAERVVFPTRPAPDPARPKAALLAAAMLFSVAISIPVVLAIRRGRRLNPRARSSVVVEGPAGRH